MSAVPVRLGETRVCAECHCLMRRGTNIVFLGMGRVAHASRATCQAALRRAKRRAS